MNEAKNKIDIRELRIGSYIYSDYDDEAKIIVVSKLESGLIGGDYLDDDSSIFEESNRFKPIPITAEWLEQLGFELDNTGLEHIHEAIYGMKTISDDDRRTVYLDVGFDGDAMITINGNRSLFADYDMDIKVKYVHQMQNLVFALTGKELEVVA